MFNCLFLRVGNIFSYLWNNSLNLLLAEIEIINLLLAFLQFSCWLIEARCYEYEYWDSAVTGLGYVLPNYQRRSIANWVHQN